MSRGALNFNESKVEYYTPKYIVDMFGPFDYDPATTGAIALLHCIPYYTTKETDGLTTNWCHYPSIWCNPPFDKKHLFWAKGCETYRQIHNNIYFLLPTNFLTTKRFHEPLQGLGVKIYLPNSRIKFLTPDGIAESPAFGSVIVKIQDKNELELINI